MNLMTRGSGTGDSDEWHHRHLMKRSEPPNLDRQRLWTTGSRLNGRKREERIERLGGSKRQATPYKKRPLPLKRVCADPSRASAPGLGSELAVSPVSSGRCPPT